MTRFNHKEAWKALASALFFQDAMSGALLMPVLPAFVGQLLGIESTTPNFSTALVLGVLVCCYYLGRAGTLALAARLCRASSLGGIRVPPSLPRIGVWIVLSATAYVVCGVLVAVERQQQPRMSRLYILLCSSVFRALSGCLAGGHRWFAHSCLDHAVQVESPPLTEKTRHETPGFMGGLVAGYALSGALYLYLNLSRLMELLLYSAAAAAHTPALVSLMFVAWRRWCCCCCVGGIGGDGDAIDGGYSTVQGTPGGSDTEFELMGRLPWRARDDSFDSGRGLHGTAVAATGGIPEGALAAGGGEDIKIPGRYLRGCAGDAVEAERRWRLTLDWRAKERIDEVLHEAQPYFEIIKRHYPHFIHRRARNGCPVWIELPGRIDLPAIRSAGVSPEALQRHYVFVTEYLWSAVEPDVETGQAVTVLDVQGLGMRDLAGEALGFVKQATAIVQDHYVERSNRMFIVNAPSYFSFIWRVIRPMLNERTQSKISIINTDSKKIAAALLECIAPENLPPQYGGTCPLELGESEEEADLRAYVASIGGCRSGGTGRGEDEGEVEVDLLAGSGLPAAPAAVSPSKVNLSGWTKKSTDSRVNAGEARDGGTSRSPGGRKNARKEKSDMGGNGNRSGAARRVFGSVRGALGWAGGKLAWRRSPVAHLGDENGFEYDAERQRWVLRDGAAGGGPGRNEECRANDGQRRDVGERGRQLTDLRIERDRSVSSEEMTVLAIQAAHHSLSEVGTKLAQGPRDMSVATGSSVPHASRSARSLWSDADGKVGSSSRILSGEGTMFVQGVAADANEGGRHHHAQHPVSISNLIVVFPCLIPFGRRASRPDAAIVLYATSTAVREVLMLWLLSTAQDGGMDASPPRAGFFFAAGVFIAGAGQATAAAFGWCGATPREVGKEETGRRLSRAVWTRMVSVTVLGLLHLLPKLLVLSSAPAVAIPSEVLWLAITAVVAANQASLDICNTGATVAATDARSWRQQRSMFVSRNTSFSSHGGGGGGIDQRTRSTSGASSSVGGAVGGMAKMSPPVSSPILCFGDVVGSTAGPLVIALALWVRLGWPLDTSFWLVLCLCGDLWLTAGMRETKPLHARLLSGDEEENEEEEEEERRRARLFAQFV